MNYETITTTTEVTLESLRYKVLAMGELVEKQVRDAAEAFVSGNLNLADTVLRKESEVNAMEIKLDSECAELIALRQPAAIDLRRVLASSKVISNLEQIGDHAKKLARYTVALSEMNVVQPRKFSEVQSLADESLRHLREALAAYSHLDAAAAQAVIDGDQELEERHQGIARQIMSFAMEDPRLMSWCLLVSAAVKAVERVGHQGAKIAQHAIYAVEARDVRHKSLGQSETQPAVAG